VQQKRLLQIQNNTNHCNIHINSASYPQQTTIYN